MTPLLINMIKGKKKLSGKVGKEKKFSKKIGGKPYSPPLPIMDSSANDTGAVGPINICRADPAYAGQLARDLLIREWEQSC